MPNPLPLYWLTKLTQLTARRERLALLRQAPPSIRYGGPGKGQT